MQTKSRRNSLAWDRTSLGRSHKQQRVRKAFATFLVLGAVMVLSLAVYAFSNHTFLEYSATHAWIRQSQARLAAQSGIESMKAKLNAKSRAQFLEVVTSRSPLGRLVIDRESPEFFAEVYQILERGSSRPGLISESAKLNLNALDLSKKGESESRARLCALPGITIQMADALLDWLDSDNEPRRYGAESEWYVSKQSTNFSASRAMNRPMENLSQLTWVRGFDEKIVFGEDTNQNGWLDWNEDDGERLPPMDNRDGKLSRGLSEWIGVLGYESNFNHQGVRKIYLNDSDLPRLHSLVKARFGEDAANFVVAYRLEGPVITADSIRGIDLKQNRTDSFESRIKLQLEDSSKPPTSGKNSSGSVAIASSTAKGLRLDRTPTHRVESVVDLMNVSVITMFDQEEKQLMSPWNDAETDGGALIASLEDAMTTAEGDWLRGRIDLHQASLEVLLTVPGMTRQLADAIIAERRSMAEGRAKASTTGLYGLLQKGMIDLAKLRKLSPYLTNQGSVYSGFCAGHDWSSHSASIIRFTLSYDGRSVRLLEERDIGFAQLRWRDVEHVLGEDSRPSVFSPPRKLD